MSKKSNWTCTRCPGSAKCPIAEAEDCISELCKDRIKSELRETQWMISAHASEGDLLSPADLRLMLTLRSKLQQLLHRDIPGELYSAACQILDSRRLVA